MPDYVVKPVFKALEVLKCVGQHCEPMSLKDISLRVAMPKTSVMRYLRTFEMAGMIVHDAIRNLYRIDTRLMGMVSLASEVERLRAICLPHMHALRQLSGETINLATMEGTDIVYLEIVESGNQAEDNARIGGHHPAHTTALGKAMLAYLPEEALNAALPRVLRGRTQWSIRERKVLLDALQETLAQGFAEDVGENIDGAICLGAPVANASGAVVAAVSVSAASARTDQWKAAVVPKLISRTKLISAELGFRGTMQPV